MSKKELVTPLHDRAIVKPKEKETKTAAGIIIPDTAKEKPQEGVVLYVGKGSKTDPMTVKKGDLVLYAKHAGAEITVNNEQVLIMKEADILAIL